jgi:hypothetical protein
MEMDFGESRCGADYEIKGPRMGSAPEAGKVQPGLEGTETSPLER